MIRNFRLKVLAPLAALALSAALGGHAGAQTQGAPLPRLDYGDPANWLCLPGRADACAVDLSVMRVNSRGQTNLDEFEPARSPRVDCFYVYPTLSPDPGEFSDMNPGPEERRIIAQQFARFSAACRTFAPLYRQYTLRALGRVLDPSARRPIDVELATAPPRGGGAYADVVEAFRHYMANDNQGRGVVLIGHSQGAMHLTRLIAEEFDGTPLQGQLVSAILLGANVQVPQGLNLGGSFRSIPLCRADNQTGCVITYSSYRDTDPPGEGAFFGQGVDGMIAGCTNPADLRRGTGQPDSIFQTGTAAWTGDPLRPVGTPFVQTPGLVTTTCVSGPAGTYLQVHVNADPRGARIDEIPGDIMRQGGRDRNWGLHLADFELSMGDLVQIVQRQARAWRPPSGR
jgi:hypothetical protein